MRALFVIHERHATNLHFDLRLEIEGVLRSWAVPKGVSMNPADRRLAIAVPDHALSYADFEGRSQKEVTARAKFAFGTRVSLRRKIPPDSWKKESLFSCFTADICRANLR